MPGDVVPREAEVARAIFPGIRLNTSFTIRAISGKKIRSYEFASG